MILYRIARAPVSGALFCRVRAVRCYHCVSHPTQGAVRMAFAVAPGVVPTRGACVRGSVKIAHRSNSGHDAEHVSHSTRDAAQLHVALVWGAVPTRIEFGLLCDEDCCCIKPCLYCTQLSIALHFGTNSACRASIAGILQLSLLAAFTDTSRVRSIAMSGTL